MGLPPLVFFSTGIYKRTNIPETCLSPWKRTGKKWTCADIVFSNTLYGCFGGLCVRPWGMYQCFFIKPVCSASELLGFVLDILKICLPVFAMSFFFMCFILLLTCTDVPVEGSMQDRLASIELSRYQWPLLLLLLLWLSLFLCLTLCPISSLSDEN